MKILIINRDVAEHLNPEEPYIHISITDRNSNHPKVPENSNRLKLLKLKFDDVDRDWPRHGLYTITESDAKQIVETLMEYKNKVSLIVCQCDGGISRSAGTAVAISRILGLDDKWIYQRYIPNTEVISKITRSYRQLFVLHK